MLSFKVLKVIVPAFVLVFAGCGPIAVHLNKSPSSGVIATISSDQSKNVSYTFESRLPDDFRPFDNRVQVNINNYYASNLKHYMSNKYSVVSGSSDYKVEFVLESSKSEWHEAGETVAKATYSDGTVARASVQHIAVSTELTVRVKVTAGGKETEKEIISIGEYTAAQDATPGSFNAAIEKSILLIDKFLDGVMVAGTNE
jgi:hypothetical protein